MSMFSAFNINASGMTAQRYRMDIISENVANANTTRTAEGGPYRRKVVTFAEKGGQTSSFSHILGEAVNGRQITARHILGGTIDGRQASFSHISGDGVSGSGYLGQGVKVSGVYKDYEKEMNMVYDPSHPDADENGYVTYPNVNIITEMTDMIDASRAYEANATAFSASKSLATRGLEIARG